LNLATPGVVFSHPHPPARGCHDDSIIDLTDRLPFAQRRCLRDAARAPGTWNGHGDSAQRCQRADLIARWNVPGNRPGGTGPHLDRNAGLQVGEVRLDPRSPPASWNSQTLADSRQFQRDIPN
jgi:hypothetical protein